MCQDCIDRFSKMDMKIIDAIINNREEFLSLMEKIHTEMGGELVRFEIQVDPAKTEEFKAAQERAWTDQQVLVGLYVTSFLLQTEVRFDGNMQMIINMIAERGGDDGHAYDVVSKMRRN